MGRLPGLSIWGAAVLLLAFDGPAAHAVIPAPEAAREISVLTYNVRGLPWPIANGRSGALRSISARLAALRKQGRQPHIIVLQEAFTADAKRIGPDAGYRYVVNGPATSDEIEWPTTSEDRRFVAGARWVKGETQGKFIDSGLQILSDYPVLSVRRAPFPKFACAGYDCLANKGVMIVLVRVPGFVAPVQIATTHLNSRPSSGVSDARSLYAYQRQVDALDGFMRANRDARFPIVFAGDFNVGKARARRATLFRPAQSGGRRWPVAASHDALRACARRTRFAFDRFGRSAREALLNAGDWQFFQSGSLAAIAASTIQVPFGRERDNRMLSEHIGYTAVYRLIGETSVPVPVTA